MLEQRRKNEFPVTTVAIPDSTREDDGVTIDLVDLMYRILASWKMITCLIVIFTIIAGAYTVYFVVPMYRATATVYVISPSDSVIDMSDLQIGSALTSDYIKVFDMWEVHEQVITNLKLPYSYKQMSDMLSVVNVADTRMLDISVTSSNAQETALIANEYATVASQYIADTMLTDKPSMMSVALVPSNPISPSTTRNCLIGFLLGAMIGVGIVTLQTIMDDKYKTAEDIRMYTGLPTLAVIPKEMPEKANGQKGKKK